MGQMNVNCHLHYRDITSSRDDEARFKIRNNSAFGEKSLFLITVETFK